MSTIPFLGIIAGGLFGIIGCIFMTVAVKARFDKNYVNAYGRAMRGANFLLAGLVIAIFALLTTLSS